MRILTIFALLFGTAIAQVPSPPIPVTGSLGAGGVFPVLNAGTIVYTTDADHPMTYPESSAYVIRLVSSSPLTSTRLLVAPVRLGFSFFIENATQGGQSITVIGSSGTGVTIPNGSSQAVWCDGTNYIQGSTFYQTVQSNGTALPQQTVLNFNSTLSATNGSGTTNVGLPSIGGGGTCSSPSSLTTDAQGRVTACSSGSGAGVQQIVAGTNVTISPVYGTGVVTVNSTASGGGNVVANNETSARFLGVQYQNTGTTYMTVNAVIGLQTGSYGEGFGFIAQIGASYAGTEVGAGGQGNSPGYANTSFDVPAGWYYDISRNDANVLNPQQPQVISWVEFTH